MPKNLPGQRFGSLPCISIHWLKLGQLLLLLLLNPCTLVAAFVCMYFSLDFGAAQLWRPVQAMAFWHTDEPWNSGPLPFFPSWPIELVCQNTGRVLQAPGVVNWMIIRRTRIMHDIHNIIKPRAFGHVGLENITVGCPNLRADSNLIWVPLY